MLPLTLPHNIDPELLDLEDKDHYRVKEIIRNNWKSGTIKRNLESKKPINQYALDGKYICTYSCVKEAMVSLSMSRGEAIYAAVNPKRKGETAYGFMWKYDDGNHSDIVPIKYKKKKNVLKIDKDSRMVIEEYASMACAARTLKVSMNKIHIACEGRDSFSGFYLRYK